MKPVNIRNSTDKVPEYIYCPHCNAPHNYIYRNNGVRKSQYQCKVCKKTFHNERRELKAKFFCPYCNYALYTWRKRQEVTIYKCGNDACPKYEKEYNKLSRKEKKLLKTHSSQFKLHYQYREYHYSLEQLEHSKPQKPKVNLKKIHNSQNILGLILTFFVSFAMSARKTALVLRWVFQINISYQTVLNYAEAAAYYAHQFNLCHKGTVDSKQAGDETYIKIKGKNNYVFFFISAAKRIISSYHIADNRGTLPATTAMLEAIRTNKNKQQTTFITDANPSYQAGIHFINALNGNLNIKHQKVVGLQNLDDESETYRPFKQIIERLNRTYKHHVRPANGFNTMNGAVALTTLFVTHYNFLRPHTSLKYKVPVPIKEIETVESIQAKWIKILSLVPALANI